MAKQEFTKQEFTKQELIELLEKHEDGGKISFNNLGEIIFDSKFPDELFQNASEQIIQARNDEKSYKELANILLKKTEAALEIGTQITALSKSKLKNAQSIRNLKDQLTIIENEMTPLEKAFYEIKSRIDERMRE